MSKIPHFTEDEAETIAESLGVDLGEFGLEQFRMGLDIELEHGLVDPVTDITHNDPILTGRIVLAHLKRVPDYYTRLQEIETEAERLHPNAEQPAESGDYA